MLFNFYLEQKVKSFPKCKKKICLKKYAKTRIFYLYQPNEDAFEVSYANRQRNRYKMTAIVKGKTPLGQTAWETFD